MPLCRVFIPEEGGGGSVTLNPAETCTVKEVMRQVQAKLQKKRSKFDMASYLLSVDETLCWWSEETKLFEQIAVVDGAILPLYFVIKTERKKPSNQSTETPSAEPKVALHIPEVKEVSEATPAVWRARTDCGLCHAAFTFTNRSHHCRKCGEEVCGGCSKQAWKLSKSRPAVRVCDTCHTSLKQTGERVVPLSVITMAPPSFVSSAEVKNCAMCTREPVLGLARRLHYCRVCGKMFCVSCAPTKIDLPDNFRVNPKEPDVIAPNPLRVCSHCLACLEEGVYVLSEGKAAKAVGELATPRHTSLSLAPEPRAAETPKRSLSMAPPPPPSSPSSSAAAASASPQRGSLVPTKDTPKSPKARGRTESKNGDSSNDDTDDEATASSERLAERASKLMKATGTVTSPLPALVASMQEEDTQQAVSYLLGLSGPLETVFDSARVRFYRSQSSATPVDNSWSCPEFSLELPVPAGFKVSALVHVDAATFDFPICGTDTVKSLIDAVVSVAMGKGVKRGDMVLRVRGLQSFLSGDKLLVNYQCVRDAWRKGYQLHLVLMAKPATASSKDAPVWTGWGGGPKALPALPKATPLADVSSKGGVFSAADLTLHGLVVDAKKDVAVVVRMLLFHGCSLLPDSSVSSSPAPYVQTGKKDAKSKDNTGSCAWVHQELVLPVFSQGVPRETKIGFAVSVANSQGSELVACVTLPLFDERGLMIQGLSVFRLHEPLRRLQLPGGDEEEKLDELVNLLARHPIGDNPNKQAAMLSLKFAEFGHPVLFSSATETSKPSRFTLSSGLTKCLRCGYPQEKNSRWCFGCGRRHQANSSQETTQSDHRNTVVESREVLLARDPLYQLTRSDKSTLWASRASLRDKQHMLPFFLQSTDWGDPSQRAEAYKLLRKWAPPTLETNLQLLDVCFADATVRSFASHNLSLLSASQLEPFLLQLTQCLKFELYHSSALSVMLVNKALRHPLSIGHSLFWHMKTEMQCQPAFAERFSLILADILACGGPLIRELRRQCVCLEQLTRIANQVVVEKAGGKKSKDKIQAGYLEELVKLNCYFFARLSKLKLPLNPQVEVGTLIVEKCRFMSSKKVPLWLVFQNADRCEARPVFVLFKSGDDLRQDILTLQLLTVMGDIWFAQGLDLCLTPYRVVSTGVNHLGEGLGMIEVVLDSDTTSGIQADFGGGALGAFKLNTIDDFLRKHNPEAGALEAAKKRFLRSSAGYCVATYVIGIGDRHNGNIMVSKSGHLFHIDFGHFLGNFKSKFGYKRERAPFVFTPEMAFVIGGKNFSEDPSYQHFEQLCVQAFNALRAKAALLETLFGLMVSAGMPELLHVSDIDYMRDQLCLDLSDEDAAAVFLRDLKTSVTATSRRIDNFIHIAKHG